MVFEDVPESQRKDAPVYSPPVLPAKVAERNDKIRIALLNQAQKDFAATPLNSAYGRELQMMQDQVNATLRGGAASVHYKMAFIDPVRYDAGSAFNMNPQRVVTEILDSGNIWPDNNILFGAAKDMRATAYNGKYASGRRENASAFVNNFREDAQVCVVVPSSDIAPVEIKGMPYNVVVDYVNRHESFHCRDTKYNFRGVDPQLVAQVKPENPGNLVGRPDLQNIFLTMHKREVFADVSAIAEMVRNGHEPKSLLGPLKDWRTKEGGTDISHYTTPALEALEKKIKDMGVAKFRALDAEAVSKLCYEITDQNALRQRELDAMLRYRAGTDKDKAALRKEAAGDRETARALGVESDIAKQLAVKPKGWTALTPAEQKLDDQVRGYPASKLLQDRAFEIGGKITPVTMAKAYAAIHDELRLEREWEPDNPIPAAKMTKLQHTLLRELRILDYAYLNQQRGVKIEDVEPCLAAFKSPAAAKAAPKKTS
jgi:hypothetical protein